MDNPILDYDVPPRGKKKWRRRWLLILLCTGFLLAGVTLLMPTLNWSGGAWVEVTVRVTDAQTGNALSHATLQFLNNAGLPSGQPGTTNASGIGTVGIIAGAGGSRSLFYQSMGYGRTDRVILVQIPGYADKAVAPGRGRTFSILGIGPKPKLRVEVQLTPQAAAIPTQPSAN